MECVNAELIGSDTGRNDLTKVPSRFEDVGTYSEHHESVGVQTHGRGCVSLPFGCTGKSSNGCAEDEMKGDAGIAEAKRMDFKGEGEIITSR